MQFPADAGSDEGMHVFINIRGVCVCIYIYRYRYGHLYLTAASIHTTIQAALLFLAAGKRTTLANLAKTAKDERKALARLMQHDMTTARGRQVRVGGLCVYVSVFMCVHLLQIYVCI